MIPRDGYTVVAAGKYFHFCDGHWAWFDQPQSTTQDLNEAIRMLRYADEEYTDQAVARTPGPPFIAHVRIKVDHVAVSPDTLAEARAKRAMDILGNLSSDEAQMVIDHVLAMNKG